MNPADVNNEAYFSIHETALLYFLVNCKCVTYQPWTFS